MLHKVNTNNQSSVKYIYQEDFFYLLFFAFGGQLIALQFRLIVEDKLNVYFCSRLSVVRLNFISIAPVNNNSHLKALYAVSKRPTLKTQNPHESCFCHMDKAWSVTELLCSAVQRWRALHHRSRPTLWVALGDVRHGCSCSAMETHLKKLCTHSSRADLKFVGL